MNSIPAWIIESIFNLAFSRNVREVMIWDVAGRLIHREPVNGRGVIEMNLYAKGTYAIGLAPMDGDHIQTKKLVVIGD